ncbi:MAG: hypothetical protein LBI37_01365 [Puniceicoccales bacterium]|jgi:hypothetical protein|nr:hypothetical protein [Puniceicoccales bacterium]
MIPRVIIILLSMLMCSCSYRNTLIRDDVKIRYVLIKEKQKNDFIRIGDIFKKSKSKNHLCVLPADAEKGGLYFVIGLNTNVKNLPSGSSMEIKCLFSSEDKQEVVYCAPINCKFDERLNEIYFKISDDANLRRSLTAWKIVIYSDQVEQIVLKKSYLWIDNPN